MKKYFLLLALIILNLAILSPAKSANRQLHENFTDWTLFSIDHGDRRICYIASTPLKKDGTYNRRGEPYFLIVSFDNYEEITISSGDNYKKESQVELSFGLRKFNIFTYQNLAWSNDRDDDLEIIKELRKSEDVIVSSILSNNKTTEDTYSLVGFQDAYEKMSEECHENKDEDGDLEEIMENEVPENNIINNQNQPSPALNNSASQL